MTVGPAKSGKAGVSHKIASYPNTDTVDGKIGSTPRSRKRPRMTRLVSQEEIRCLDMQRSYHDENCPATTIESLPCAPEYNEDDCEGEKSKAIPCLPNPLLSSKMLESHLGALRLEADLTPMRILLGRLMAHSPQNRKGLFNRPVDPIALGLPDYHLIVTRPMDLGTIRRKLHAIAYQSREEVAEEIRLVFTNAMRYNPPHNAVHKCALELLESFEAAYKELAPVVSSPKTTVLASSGATDEGTFSAGPAVAEHSLSSEVGVVMNNTSMLHSPEHIGRPPSLSSGTANVSLGLPANAAATGSSVIAQPCRSTAVAPMHINVASVHSPATSPSHSTLPKRKSRLAPFLPHSCQSCLGRTCDMCKQGCLSHEPPLLVCQGFNCAGAKIRKAAIYFIAKDGSRQFCQRCYTNLPPILPTTSNQDKIRYKQDLLKRINNEEIVEDWLTCVRCKKGVHKVCAMHNGFVHNGENFVCLMCKVPDLEEVTPTNCAGGQSDSYSFVCGVDLPIPLSSLVQNGNSILKADDLKECAVSSFIQNKIRSCMKTVPNAEKTVVVRIISDCSRHFKVPEVVRKHFRVVTESDCSVKPPTKVNYRQKAITLFQKIDGLDVCIFCMYVQEYDGNDDYEEPPSQRAQPSHQKRVYIAYLDSVEHFRPRECRTQVYQEMLVSYLASARRRGYECAHIWACPPSRGNSFVFWNHPSSQRTPTKERLISWYHGALSRAINCGVVTDVKSLYESDFQGSLTELERANDSTNGEPGQDTGKMICPPLLDGDFWIEEAVRLHSTSIARHLKTKSSTDVCVWNVASPPFESLDPCPALQVAALIRDRVMTHPCSVPFRRPVNAAAMKLKDYHKMITKPMDLGTVYSHCIHGEYQTLRDAVCDVELLVANAKKFNPVGHFVHLKADEVMQLFFEELCALTKFWVDDDVVLDDTWERFADMSMSLEKTIDMTKNTPTKSAASVVIEDDRSSDGSRSLMSTSSVSASPISRPSPRDDDSLQPQPCILSAGAAAPKTRRPSLKTKKSKESPPMKKLELLAGGAEAVMQHMIGEDTWLMDKRNPSPPKVLNSGKKAGGKRRRNSIGPEDNVTKRRRQSWLSEEVCDAVRKMRTSFFMCSLIPKVSMNDQERKKVESFASYTKSFAESSDSEFSFSSRIVDARHALLEFSQFRHFEFDTLRRAKYSTTMLLYHLQNSDAPGIVPACTGCGRKIQQVRWHKVKKPGERRRCPKLSTTLLSHQKSQTEWEREELCSCCHSKLLKGADDFIPIPVSLKS